MRKRAVLLVGLVWMACGQEAPTASSAGELEVAFAEAAARYQVPVGLLECIAYVETRVSARPVQGARGGWGTLQLSAARDWDVVAEGAKLTGQDEGAVKTQAAANVLAGAAVLRRLFDDQQRRDGALDAREAGDWYDAVALFPGLESPTVAHEWAAQVYARLEQGFSRAEAPGVRVAPTASTWRARAPRTLSQHDALGDYPNAAAFAQSPNYTSGRSSYDYIVIHTMQGSYSGTKSWFLNTASQVSAHYIVRSSDGQITQMVSDADTAWHAQCYNSHAIGIEHEGYIAAPDTWYTDAMYTESAKLTRWLTDRHGIAKDRTHIIGHYEVASSCNTNGHEDPGTGWNWTKYMALVTGSSGTGSTGVLTGVIYTGGDTNNRLDGVVVSANGQRVTTSADGVYQFTLAPGTYTVTATKSGYAAASATGTVTANGTVWASMQLTPSTSSTGTVTGVIFALKSGAPTDMSTPLSGALVSAGGQTVQTDATGSYTLTLSVGAATLSVSASGYQPAQQPLTVTAGTTTANVGLTASATQGPALALETPQDGSSLDVGVVDVRGTAADPSSAVSLVTLNLNGGPSQSLALSGGHFSTQVTLRPGANTLVAIATDSAGKSTRLQAQLTFNAGVRGVVHPSTDASKVVAGASLELRDAHTGASLATASSDAAGRYFLGVTQAGVDVVLVATASGYRTQSQTVSLPADKTLALDLSLVAGSDATTSQLAVRFVAPTDGATVTQPTVVVYGLAEGFELAAVEVAGVAGTLTGTGAFSASVPVQLGRNALPVVATGLKGERVASTLTLNRQGTPAELHADGGCSTTGGGLALLGMVALLARRRPRPDVS